MRICLLIVLVFITTSSYGQVAEQDSTENINELRDSLYIAETENVRGKDKVLHAEPLFIDLIRDLGARKGEREWNIGMGMTDQRTFDSYLGLVEYEFAPLDRLGVEVELPFSFYYPTDSETKTEVPQSRLNSLKLATQFSFFVSERYSTSMAVGYIHEFELTSFKKYGKEELVKGNVYNPFFVAAKRWGHNFHTLLYTGPLIEHHFKDNAMATTCQVNTNFHYMITGTRNFIGVEFNKEFHKGDFDMTIRPQMRVGITDNLLVGIVTGIPINRENQRFSSFLRLIYEPRHKAKHG
ncbi:MAG TPA: HAEPLYID family protein [Flavipsychrobacter sp.]|nr:HAEPLYID family protein [Flavipsychrobacter sp.]